MISNRIIFFLFLIILNTRVSAENELELPLIYYIPEPMVFDLVRPLGAREGELEINVLGLFPLNNRGRTRSVRDTPDGLIRSSSRERIDWAPEIEYAVLDDFALELEFPFEDNNLVAFKFAYQWTFGTLIDDQMIHGTQGILEHNRFTEVNEISLLYLNAFLITPELSIMSMSGVRFESGGKVDNGPLELILNLSLFYEVFDKHSLGFETNFSFSYDFDEISLLLMPQWQWEFSKNYALQSGIGVQISDERVLPLIGTRLVWTY
jgi:hypothetical protein